MTAHDIRTLIRHKYPIAYQYIFKDRAPRSEYDKIEREMLRFRREDPDLWGAADNLEGACMCPPTMLDPDTASESEYDEAGCFGCNFCWEQAARRLNS